MKIKESYFVRCFRLSFIVEREQLKVRKSLLKSKDNKQIIALIKRHDTLQRRKDLINKIKLM